MLNRLLLAGALTLAPLPALAALAIDGTASANTGGATSVTTGTLTAASVGDVCIVYDAVNAGNTGTSGSAVTDSGSNTWTLRKSQVANSSVFYIEEWYLLVGASTAYSGTITVTQPTSGYIAVSAFCVSGENRTTTFDPNASVPDSDQFGNPGSITTNNNNVIVISGQRIGASTGTPATGFTSIYNNNYLLTQYELFSSGASAVNVLASPSGAYVGDAIVAAAGGGGGPSARSFTTMGIGQ